MIIWVRGGIADFGNPLRDEFLNALTDLGDSGYAGRHVILASRELLTFFSSLAGISPRARAYFARVAAEYTQLGHVLAHPVHLVASADAIAPVLYGSVWTVPLSLFSVPEHSQSATVVCENDTDFDVLHAFAELFVREHLPGCAIHARSHAGGGGGTTGVLRRLLPDAHPIIYCVLDSDREVVLGSEGSTARGVRAMWRDSWRSHLYVLTARELENVLPHDAVMSFAEYERADTSLLSLFPFVHDDISLYVCLKQGEQLCRFHDITSGQNGHGRTVVALNETGRRHPNFRQCSIQCDGCECKVTPQLGPSFLERFASWIGHFSNRRNVGPSPSWPQDLRAAVDGFVNVSLALPRKL